MNHRFVVMLLGAYLTVGVRLDVTAACLSPVADLNASGLTDVVDSQCSILLSLWALGGKITAKPSCLAGSESTADVNCDGDMNVVDAVVVTQAALKAPLDNIIDKNGNQCPDACEAAGCVGLCGNVDGCCPNGCKANQDADCLMLCDDPSVWPTAWTQLEAQVLSLVNTARAQGGSCGSKVFAPAPPLTANALLAASARCHSVDMALNQLFSHVGSDGSLPEDRIAAAGYLAALTAENVAAGTPSAEAVVVGWLASADHCMNIRNGQLENLGVGYVDWPSSQLKQYWTQNFGTLMGSQDSCLISTCVHNDGCCPLACTPAMDNDCAASCSDPGSWPGNWVSMEDQVLPLINAVRTKGTTCGGVAMPALPPLLSHAALRQSSRCHALDMAVNNFYGFVGSNGSTVPQRILGAGFVGSPVTELISAAASSAQSVVNTWFSTAQTCNFLMSSALIYAGVGHAARPTSQYKQYWALDLGGKAP
ncbi:MAG: hypothetical protein HUU55_10385 [Myxococcales bacterium]|nr:hypothetical protein [Myxococcales bacterium]